MQENEIIDNKHGVKIALPAEVTYKRLQTGFVFGHPSVKGLLMMLYHRNNNLEELKTDLYAGFYDESGFNIQIDGYILDINDSMVLADYKGLAENNPATGFCLGLLSPHGGGILLSAISSTELFTEEHKDFIEDLARKVEFMEPEISNGSEEWQEFLVNHKLSKSVTDPDSDELVEIHFTGIDTFLSKTLLEEDAVNQSFEKFESGGAKNTGQWEVLEVNEEYLLKLTFFDNTDRQFLLHYHEDHIDLNNEPWELHKLIDEPE